MKMRFLAVAAAVLLAACGSGGSRAVPVPLSALGARDAATATVVRMLPTRAVLGAAHGERWTAAAALGNDLVYHGGPVQTAPHLYVVFWGSAWNGSSGDPDGVAARLKAFYGVIGGSRWLNTVTQYYQSDGRHVGNAGSIFYGSYVDTSSAPPKAPTQSQMAAEAAKAAAHFGNFTVSASYVVALPHGIVPSGFGTQYCAYHTTTTAGGQTVAWTNLPYVPDAGSACGAGAVNSPGTLDGVTIVGGGEQAETETDPQPGTGWLSGNGGGEIGDLCSWTSLQNNPNAGGYPTAPLWSNASHGCVQGF